jgi:hypothetical protein
LMVLVGTSSTASALFMGGSTPVKATGEGCYRNSDCPAAYACLRGVCEEECVENRDCSLGSVCKKVGGAGGAAARAVCRPGPRRRLHVHPTNEVQSNRLANATV